MDYKAEQEMELEALQAIFMDDLQGVMRCLACALEKVEEGRPCPTVLAKIRGGACADLSGPLPDGWPPQARGYLVVVTSAGDAEVDAKEGADSKAS